MNAVRNTMLIVLLFAVIMFGTAYLNGLEMRLDAERHAQATHAQA